jgi:hypothetical protein
MFVYLFIYVFIYLCLYVLFLTQHFFVCRINPVLVLSISGDLKLISLSQRQNLLLLAFFLFCELFQMERDVYSLEFAINGNAVTSFS